MDIFNKIDNETQQQKQNTQQTTNFDDRFILQEGEYSIKRKMYWNSYNDVPERYNYVGGMLKPNKPSRFAKANSQKIHKLLSSEKVYTSYKSYNKALKRREKKIQKLCKKGIDLSYLTPELLSKFVGKMSFDERYVLTQYGVDIFGAIKNSSKYQEILGENIYFCVEDLNNVEILENIYISTLECVLNTRKHLGISKQTIDNYIQRATLLNKEGCMKKLDRLFAFGEITVDKKQVDKLTKFFNENPSQCKYAHSLAKLCDYVNPSDEDQEKNSAVRYKTQKSIKTSTKNKTKKSEIEQQIDKLFEEAQNAID